MNEINLLEWMTALPAFKREYNELLLESVHSQFPMIAAPERIFDWDYLLKCASFLAHSKEPVLQDKALRVAQFCLQSKENTTLEEKNSAQFILNKLANRRAINLAREKGLLVPDQENWKNTFLGNLNWKKEEFYNSIWLEDGERVDVNAFQKSFWNALNQYNLLSISAPTSAGKSYLIKKWVLEKIAAGKPTQIVYVVPTRALIAEVHADFQRALSDEIKDSKVNVTAFPFVKFSDGDAKPKIYILTQERLQLFLQKNPNKIDILIVDEAYKFGDGSRGVLLQHVVEKTALLNPKVKVVFISPLVSNPEILVEDRDGGYSQKYGDITVNQNLIFASQVRGKKWTLDLYHSEGNEKIGDVALPSTPTSIAQRMTMLAFFLGQSGGNIIYVNRATDAETAASQLCDLIGLDNTIDDNTKLNDLIELCEKVIDKRYKLIGALKYGVAFHYGNMPLLIKEEIEALFREGTVKYLICTSTLVEGVNLPCKNIFVRAPKRGTGNVMTQADFWNLAGRAGRWGKDFQGNIICVDPHIWDPPKSKVLTVIEKATEQVLDRKEDLLSYIKNGTPRDIAVTKEHNILEALSSYLAISAQSFGSVKNIPLMRGQGLSTIQEFDKAINENLLKQNIPSEIISSHPGISPIAMGTMLEYFKKVDGTQYEDLLLPHAADSFALDRVISAFTIMYDRLTNEFSNHDGHIFQQALLTVKWMQGCSIKKLIEARQSKVDESIHQSINKILDMIENVARYNAPKYLGCYNDLLKYFFGSIGRIDLVNEIEDITLFLEMGVNTKTHLSLMNLGLSRTSTVEIKNYITSDGYSERECLAWFTNKNNQWSSHDLPKIVIKEIEKMLEIHVPSYSKELKT